MRYFIPAASLCLAAASIVAPCAVAEGAFLMSHRLVVHNGRLEDEGGRQVFLRGMNLGEKSPARRHASWHELEEFHNLRRWGMNAVRLLVFWSAVEPEPGQYDEEYLRGVDQRIAWAREAGLYVILDMHQDLWGTAIPGGNGAPPWATLDDGLEHRTLPGASWGVAYFTSPRVKRAFDNFWDNAPGPGGVGIQDRFALAWRHVAARYADTPTVIGFDLFNEPFPGAIIDEAGLALWRALPDILRDFPMPGGFRALMDSFKDQDLPQWFLDLTDDSTRHRRLVQVLKPTMHTFERDKLMPMYRRVHRAIREVHPKGIFFLEPCIMANVGVPTFIEALTDDAGNRDPLQAYMPHAYDIVVDTNLSHLPSKNRLAVIFGQQKADAERLGMPLLNGEWGAFYGNDKTRDAARLAAGFLEEHTVGSFYWDYHRHMEEAVYFEMLSRPSPLLLAGTSASSSYDPDTGVFRCTWRANPDSALVSRFAAPIHGDQVDLEIGISPDIIEGRIETHPDDPHTRYVVIPAPNQAVTLTLTIVPREN